MSTTIYYFTGTGNSLKVAKDLSDALGDVQLIKICKNSIGSTKEVASEKIGFVFPVYFSGIPVMVKNFLEKLQVNKNAYIFAIATFGGSVGISIKQIEDLFNKKGIKLSANFGIPMPGNYQIMYSPYSEEKQKKLFKEEREKILEVAQIIKNNQVISNNSNAFMNAIGEVLYKTFKPSDKDKNFWIDEKCNGCGTCEKVCPANNIKITNGKPEWQHQCELCVGCMQWCPQKSIQYKKRTVKRGRYHNPDISITEIVECKNKS